MLQFEKGKALAADKSLLKIKLAKQLNKNTTAYDQYQHFI